MVEFLPFCVRQIHASSRASSSYFTRGQMDTGSGRLSTESSALSPTVLSPLKALAAQGWRCGLSMIDGVSLNGLSLGHRSIDTSR